MPCSSLNCLQVIYKGLRQTVHPRLPPLLPQANLEHMQDIECRTYRLRNKGLLLFMIELLEGTTYSTIAINNLAALYTTTDEKSVTEEKCLKLIVCKISKLKLYM
ncbi:uncharacterized protein LOC126740895 [Anthonomus grandis grandis]|uniref:uncharacterized protein LOC126740895 n=1 Tax=Anthonomus grandis grandis TaxID=2921223 RepID=UPI002165E9B1|nr:uncharacterized protein LOC126740895 [Anthonomus grandis grandis]